MTSTQDGAADSATQEGSTQEGARRLRASDADRLAAVRVLQDAVARGLLTPEEGSDRMAAAFAAVHVSDLAALTADLPAGRPTGSAPGWRPLATMAVEQVRSSLSAVPTGSPSPVRIAVTLGIALLVLLLVLLLVGSLVGELILDGDGGRGGSGRGGSGHG